MLPFSAAFRQLECMKATEISDLSTFADNLRGLGRLHERQTEVQAPANMLWWITVLRHGRAVELSSAAHCLQWFTLLCNFECFLFSKPRSKVCNWTTGRHLWWLVAAECLVEPHESHKPSGNYCFLHILGHKARNTWLCLPALTTSCRVCLPQQNCEAHLAE